ncbi:PREDICTED: uncharacterized protein C3orf22 homolog [Odobenus rosmarus divergens]|uniref:Uncharacterized protein C3orf22 homolog n=1 Tax=Odobenus rosmarus divergens TaxID=9708 RepID=A0A2U3VLD4_ODORO
MNSKNPKKCPQYKKSRNKAQEKFLRKFPYRFSWLTEPTVEFLKPWEVTKMTTTLRDQLPLQKTLVPTRSIPVRGLGAPDFTSLSCLSPPLPPPLLSQLWELKLVSRRFPGPGAPTVPPPAPALPTPPEASSRARHRAASLAATCPGLSRQWPQSTPFRTEVNSSEGNHPDGALHLLRSHAM